MRNLLLVLTTLVSACNTAPKPQAPEMQSWEQHIRSRPDTFMQSYQAQLAENRQQLIQQGLVADHAAVRAYVDAYLPAGHYTLQSKGATAAVQRQARVDSLTNNLVNYGYRSAQFADPAQARLLVRAAAGVFGPTAEVDLATFAPTVVLADFERADDAADGSSAVIFRVIEPIKNAPATGSQIRLTLQGPQKPSLFPPPPQPGEGELRLPGRVLLLLSPPRLVGGLGAARGDAYSRVTQPMRADGDRLTPGYHSDIPETTLTEVRAAVRRQVCAAGYVPVGVKGTSLAC
jgi:hypothetical protein